MLPLAGQRAHGRQPGQPHPAAADHPAPAARPGHKRRAAAVPRRRPARRRDRRLADRRPWRPRGPSSSARAPSSSPPQARAGWPACDPPVRGLDRQTSHRRARARARSRYGSLWFGFLSRTAAAAWDMIGSELSHGGWFAVPRRRRRKRRVWWRARSGSRRRRPRGSCRARRDFRCRAWRRHGTCGSRPCAPTGQAARRSPCWSNPRRRAW